MSTLLEQASLVLIPSGYKEDIVYSVIPSNGSGDMSFTRASDGTRINSAGLVENTPWNLFQQSETFENASWTKNNISVATGIGTTPEGLPYRILTNTVNGFNSLAQTPPLVIGNFYSVTIVLKKGTAISVGFRVGAGTWGDAKYNFDTDTFVGSAVALASRRFLGDGWIEIKYQNFEALQTNFRVFVSSSTTGNSLDGLIGQTLLISRMQVNIGSTAKPYFPTTDRLNVPRLTYQNGGGGCPSLLLEPQRTNLVLRSQELDNASWLTQAGSSITPNQIISPDGTQNADMLNVVIAPYSYVYQIIASGSNNYSISIYAKKGTKNWLFLLNTTGGGARAWFNVNTGTIGTVASGYTATITNAGNGWYRCTMTNTVAELGTYVGFGFVDADNTVAPTSTGNGYLWGAQLESASYNSSYIPTVASSATRIADACSKTGISSLIGQTEGVLFTDFVCNGFQDNGTALSVNNGAGTQFIVIRILSNGNIRGWLYNGSTQAEITYTGGVVGQRYKLAFAYKTNDFAMYVNGSLVGTDVSGTTFSGTTLSRVDFDLGNTPSYVLSLIQVNQAILFKTRLTNAELATLTTI